MQFVIKDEFNTLKLEKRVVLSDDPESIAGYGVHEFAYKTQAVLFEDTLADTLLEVKSRARDLLNKYACGVPYMETQWVGDGALKLGDVFIGESPYGDKTQTPYECLSNELTFDTAFRQKTKGRAVS